MAHSIQASVKKLKADLAEMRQNHVHQAAAFSLSLLQARQEITAGLSVAAKMGGMGSAPEGMKDFRRDRLKLSSMKEDYDKRSKPTLRELE